MNHLQECEMSFQCDSLTLCIFVTAHIPSIRDENENIIFLDAFKSTVEFRIQHSTTATERESKHFLQIYPFPLFSIVIQISSI